MHHEFMGRCGPFPAAPTQPGPQSPACQVEQGPALSKGRSQPRGGPALNTPSCGRSRQHCGSGAAFDVALQRTNPEAPGQARARGRFTPGGPSWSRRARGGAAPHTGSGSRSTRSGPVSGGRAAACSARPRRAVLPSDPARPAFLAIKSRLRQSGEVRPRRSRGEPSAGAGRRARSARRRRRPCRGCRCLRWPRPGWLRAAGRGHSQVGAWGRARRPGFAQRCWPRAAQADGELRRRASGEGARVWGRGARGGGEPSGAGRGGAAAPREGAAHGPAGPGAPDAAPPGLSRPGGRPRPGRDDRRAAARRRRCWGSRPPWFLRGAP